MQPAFVVENNYLKIRLIVIIKIAVRTKMSEANVLSENIFGYK